MFKTFFIATGLLFGFCGGLVSSALALPVEEANQKLKVLPLFLLTDKNGSLIQNKVEASDGGIQYVSPVFTEISLAELRMKNLISQSNLQDLRIFTTNMAELGKIKETAQKALNEKLGASIRKEEVLFPVVVKESTRQAVAEIHAKNADNANKDLISQGIPIFYASPMLNTGTGDVAGIPKGKDLFFFRIEQLRAILNGIPNQDVAKEVVVKAARLSDVIRLIVSEENDRYYFYPSPDYIRQNNL